MYQIKAQYQAITAHGQVDAADEQAAIEQAKKLLLRPFQRKYGVSSMPEEAVITATLIEPEEE